MSRQAAHLPQSGCWHTYKDIGENQYNIKNTAFASLAKVITNARTHTATNLTDATSFPSSWCSCLVINLVLEEQLKNISHKWSSCGL